MCQCVNPTVDTGRAVYRLCTLLLYRLQQSLFDLASTTAVAPRTRLRKLVGAQHHPPGAQYCHTSLDATPHPHRDTTLTKEAWRRSPTVFGILGGGLVMLFETSPRGCVLLHGAGGAGDGPPELAGQLAASVAHHCPLTTTSPPAPARARPLQSAAFATKPAP